MSKRTQPIWICEDCGEEQTAWSGRCPNCGVWNTLKEVKLPVAISTRGRVSQGIPEIATLTEEHLGQLPERLQTSMGEVDRVLGGGFFPGTVGLIAGEPGIGKSTLLLMLAHRLAQSTKVIYASGEESVQQIRQRATRLGIVPSPVELIATTELAGLLQVLNTRQPGFVIIDSIQTLVDLQYPSAAGSVVQVRECALTLQRWAKATGNTLMIVGHVTKEGVVAGPRTLEHLVDVVITLEGERSGDLRILRTVKNRFGPTEEVGILAMTSTGFEPVSNPSARFINDQMMHVPGSVITVSLEGQRPILVEIQALTRPMVGAYPRRAASGFDLARLELLLAVLEARGGLRLGTKDCFVNVSGGFRLREPAADTAVVAAIASAVTNRPIAKNLVIFGELGLSGEIRPVTQLSRRQEEARRLGFEPIPTYRSLRELLDELGINRNTKSTEIQKSGVESEDA